MFKDCKLLPYPKEIEKTDGFFKTHNCVIAISDGVDSRIFSAANKARKELSAADATYHKLYMGVSDNGILINTDCGLGAEEYRLEITEQSVKLTGGSGAGCFYGLQTLRQLIKCYKSSIPAFQIHDWPDLKFRGFYHDATRGRVPTVDGVKRIIDTLAELKYNSFQLYIEHTFDFAEFSGLNRSEQEYLTVDDILEIDNYCYENFIDFIPSLSTFGHLYELLSLKDYSHLCELENYKPQFHFWKERMLHHTIDASNPESFNTVCSLIDQYIPLFRSGYFNICCDETFDICLGRNRGKDKGKLYCEFVNRLINYIASKGKTAMMWSDIVLKYPEYINQISKDTVLLNWDYEAEPNLNTVDIISKSGYAQIVCPGTDSWASLIENPKVSFSNITKLIGYGAEKQCFGALITNWGDYGHPAPFECALSGTALGAAKAWNVSTVVNEAFESSVSFSMYSANYNIVPYVREIAYANKITPWQLFVSKDKAAIKNALKKSGAKPADYAEKCLQTAEKLSESGGNNLIIRQIITAAKGTALLNSAGALLLSDGDFSEWKKEADKWLKEYKEGWLLGNKPSELYVIEEFINSIPSIGH